jgi:hypothetical protein
VRDGSRWRDRGGCVVLFLQQFMAFRVQHAGRMVLAFCRVLRWTLPRREERLQERALCSYGWRGAQRGDKLPLWYFACRIFA